MNDDDLRRQLSRRADASGSTPELLPTVRQRIASEPQRLSSSRVPAFAGLAAAIAVLLAVAVAIPAAVPRTTPPAAAPATPTDLASPTNLATPQLASPFSRFACPPVRPSLGDVAPSVLDLTGLVEGCVAATPDELEGGGVSNPDGDLTALDVEWTGSSCHAAATLSLSNADEGYRLDIAPVGVACRLLMATYAVRLVLRAEVAANEVRVVEGPPVAIEPGAAVWELAPHERPRAESTSLDVVVHERACANGQSPAGRIGTPEVEYSESLVEITFSVAPLPGGGDCSMAPGAPYTVELPGTLGDRRLIDGYEFSGDVVLERTDDFLALATHRVDGYAYERFFAMVGGIECTTSVTVDRYVPTQQEIEEAANGLDEDEGFIEYGGYVSDDWMRAARAFGAIEAYAGRPKPWYMVRAVEGSLALTSLNPVPISGGRTVWFPGDRSSIVVPECTSTPTPTPRAGNSPLRHECTPLPLAPGASPSPRPLNSVVDETGLIELCSQTDAIPELVGDISVSNQDARQVAVIWAIPGCLEFTFRAFGERYELVGRTTQTPCFGGPIFLRFFDPMPAERIDARIEAGEDTPSIPVGPADMVECGPVGDLIGQTEWAETTLRDHTGLVTGCRTWFGTTDPLNATVVVTGDTTGQSPIVEWDRPACESAVVDLWRPMSAAQPTNSNRYVLGITTVADPQTDCDHAGVSQAVMIELRTPITPDELDAFVWDGATGRDFSEAGKHRFEFVVSAGEEPYDAWQPIDFTAELTYRGPDAAIAVMGAPALFLGGFEQLDGELSSPTTGTILPCVGHGELTRDQPRDYAYRLPDEWPAHPEAEFFERYVDGGFPTLPAGLYRFYASTSFAGESCNGPHVGMTASVIVRVEEPR